MKIKLVSLNLWNGGYLFRSVIDFLKDQDADIVFLQEVYNAHDDALVENYRSLDALREHLAYPHESFAPAMLDKLLVGKIEEGNAVLSKFPIRSTDIRFFNEPYSERDPYDSADWPVSPRNLQHVVIDVNGIEVNGFNFQGVYDLDGDNFSEQRRTMSNTIIDSARGKRNVIIGGDTNARPTNPAMQNIAQHFTDVFGPELKTTFNMRRKDNPGYATSVVDLLYVSPEIHVVNKVCPEVDVSDHLPLVVELEITNQKKELG